MSSSGGRILIVDDNPSIHTDFRKILLSGLLQEPPLTAAAADLFGGEAGRGDTVTRFELESASQGEAGLELVRRALWENRPFAVAFMDVRMPPGWDGIETTAKIWEVDPAVQVVLCTAYSDYSWKETVRQLGVSDRLVILKKPFDSIEVLQLASTLTEKWRLQQKANAAVQDLNEAVSERTEQLRRSEYHYRLIAENAVDLITVVDKQGRCLYRSPSHKKVLGFPAQERSGECVLEQVHPEDGPRFMSVVHDSLQGGVTQNVEYRVRHKDNSWRSLEAFVNPALDGPGRARHVVIVARDVTERKRAEHERAALQIQLQQAQKLESIGRLAAGIAHEINTPTQYVGDNIHFFQKSFTDLDRVLETHARLVAWLNARGPVPEEAAEILRATEKVRTGFLRSEIPKAIADAQEGIGRVTKIVRAMKDFSHPGCEEKRPVDLNRTIESTLTVSRNEWKYVAEMVTELDPDLPPVPCLPGEFNQVILNLVVNAAHAIADVVGQNGETKGTITVSSRTDGDWVEVRIKDTGTGIPEKVRSRIFEPFFTTKEVGKGTGQGLSMSRSVIVERHGGTIHFETEAGRGTTFIIRLPLRLPSVKEKAAPA